VAVAKRFTRDEAEAFIPRVEPLLREIQALRAGMVEREEELARLQVKAASNGHSHLDQIRLLQTELATLGQEIAARIATINRLGILIKDLEMGLIDFPTLRDGREVYLCWRLGEQGISWWHEIESGFAGRQRLED
jgi:hypothetical protein